MDPFKKNQHLMPADAYQTSYVELSYKLVGTVLSNHFLTSKVCRTKHMVCYALQIKQVDMQAHCASYIHS